MGIGQDSGPIVRIEDATVTFPALGGNRRHLTSLVQSISRRNGKHISHSTPKAALANVNITLASGQRLGIVGSNGAGKSTLLRVIAGIYKPTQGSALIRGKLGSLLDISLGISPELTGYENIFIRGILLDIPRSEMKNLAEEIIEFSGLGDAIFQPVRTYSSGMQMRLAFSIATSVHPEVIVMDEWLSVGDASFVEKAELRLAEIVNKSEILVIASHSRQLISDLCTEVIWLENGKVRMHGETESVLESYFL